MDKRTRQEVLATPAGQELNALVERVVFDRPACVCGPIGGYDADTGICSRCKVRPPPQWSDSHTASSFLRTRVYREWPYQKRIRFLDFLGEAIAFRMQTGKVECRQWVLLVQPEDVCRAAVLTCAAEN